MTTDPKALVVQLRAWTVPVAHGYPSVARVLTEAADALEAALAEIERLKEASIEMARLFHASLYGRAPKSYQGSDWGDYLENAASFPLDDIAKADGAPMLEGGWYRRRIAAPAMARTAALVAEQDRSSGDDNG